MSKWQRIVDVGNVTSNDNRREIFETIKSNPGIHFRGICNLLSKQIGVTQYHLQTLESFGLIRSKKDGRFNRYYERQDIKGDNVMAIIAAAQRKIEKEMLRVLSSGKDPRISFKIVCETTGVTMPAVMWHAKRMRMAGLLKNDYSLVDGILSEYSMLRDKGLID